ncbi:hypothetical protein [Nostoc sp. 'Lobaria pulmonaria (5183) cyanobiont']|uniref:hypothetical protein n=1 Tax=Nostoc sp. 'Lobaria pulmonaria (5183) cyanobiont' TaxID=1618022 RepID=UPI000CF31000|nr:hypothetical protein [Nostoc sp. 'Lobaria pulmonaria (5183) cyanobiont']
MQIIDKNMARTGGNPDFGTRYKFDFGNEEVRSQALTIRITPSFLEEIKSVAGDRYRDFCRDAIVEKLGRELAAQTAKTVTTELATETGQQPDNNQTTQLNLELATDPTPGEQVTTPKTRRKATQTPAQKQAKPRSQSRSRKSSATEN